MAYQTLIVEITDHVALIRLNRPEALNALSGQLVSELAAAMKGAKVPLIGLEVNGEKVIA